MHSLEYVERWERHTLAPLVITKLGAKVIEALDYAEAERTVSLVEGFARTGKTFIAKAWANARPGRRRFVSLSEAASEKEFFMELSQAIGASTAHGLKANELRAKVNTTLRPGYITLVIDEGHYLLPTRNLREAMPRRLEWVRCSLANHGVPVAIIATHQFSRTAQLVEKNSSAWSSEQWTGRLGFCARLPDALEDADIAAIARYHLPEADRQSIEELVDYAQVSRKYLAAVDHLVKAARHEARKHGRTNVTYADITSGFDNTVAPSDRTIAAMATAPPGPAPKPRGRTSKIYTTASLVHGHPISASDLPEREVGAALRVSHPDRLKRSTSASPAAA